MKVIKVTVPKDGKKWKISFNGKTPFQRVIAVSAYTLIERILTSSLCTWAKEKTKIHVDYRQDGSFYEGTYTNPNEALYVLACFLEDYLSSSFQLSKYKKYYPKFTGEKYV